MAKNKVALITGILGQDGFYLSSLLLEKGYEVHGISRRPVGAESIVIHYGDITDSSVLASIISEVRPDEIYNLAAESNVFKPFDDPLHTTEVNGVAVCHILEAIKEAGLLDKTRLCQASSSELFGKVEESPQNEKTPFYPRSPYGVAKLFAYWMIKNYRETYNFFGCNSILYNHESPQRGELFVTKKITRTLAEIWNRKHKGPLELGNLDAKRDWGHAKDYVRAMWLMLQQDKADDYVVSTEQQHSIRELVEIACKHLGFNIEWRGTGVDEVAIDKDMGNVLVKINPDYYRPIGKECLVGDCTKAKSELDWRPEYTFEELIKEMCAYDLGVSRL